MKVNKLGRALLAAILIISFSTQVHAEDKGQPPYRRRSSRPRPTIARHVTECRGKVFADLSDAAAGRAAARISENQLQAFIERRRTNPVMFNVAHVLTPPMLTALSTHFEDLNPKPLGGAPKDRWPKARRSTLKA